MFRTFKQFLSYCKRQFLICFPTTHWPQRNDQHQMDPLELLGKTLQDTTLYDFSQGWDKTNEENDIAVSLQLQYPLHYQLLLSR